MNTSKFITFEGGEGSGKSTQARALAARLQALGHEVVVTREPGGSPVAEKVRALVLAERPQAPDAELLLFAAARAEHLAATIRPALASGAFVICDRFIDSTRIYQGREGGGVGTVAPELIDALEQLTVAPDFPALTVVLDVPAELAMARAAARGELNRYDARDPSWHRALRDAFLRIVEREPERCILVEGARDAESVAAEVWRVVAWRYRLEPC